MTFSKASGTLGLAALAAFTWPVATAQETPTGWYGGANIGQAASTIDEDRIRGALAGQGFSSSSISERDRDPGYKLYGGYRLHRNVAIEGGFFDLGEHGYTATTVPAGTLSGDVRVRGLNLDLVGILPLTSKLSALGRVGVTHASSRGSFSATGAARVPYANASPSERDTNYKFGAGLSYDFTEALSMRVEAERYRINDSVGNKGDIDLFSVGLVYRFGASPPPRPARVAMAEPARVAPAPVPAPAAATPAPLPPPAPPAPAPRPVMKVALSADSLFDFDQATVKPAGRQALDKLGADLRGISYDSVKVTGHTDRIGSSNYNMKLSTRRAQAVSAYLVQSAGVPAGKVAATGAGESSPVTAGACKGDKPNAKLIACLQPDRRVEVEVTGTR